MASGASVLVIDDDEDFRSLLSDELAQAGFIVEQAKDGRMGLARMQASDIDVILLDVEMPGLNGPQVIRAAREAGVHAEVVVMTAYPQLETALACLHAGIFDLLEKPFIAKSIVTTVKNAAERRRLRATTALYQATSAIFTATNPEHLPQIVVRTAIQVLEADEASLMLPDGTGGLAVAYSHGLPEAGRNTPAVAMGQGVAGIVAVDRKPALILGGVGSDPRFKHLLGIERVRSSIVFPLVAGEQLVGVLNVNRVNQQRPFRPADLDLANIFASQAMLALENIGLMRRLLHAERLAFLGHLMGEISHEVNNPCAYVLANLDYLQERLTTQTADEDIRGSVTEALEGARRIARVIADMRSMLKESDVARVRLDVNRPLQTALRMTQRQLDGVHVDVALGQGTWVIGDEGRLGQVFLHLLMHAGQAVATLGKGQVRIATAIADGRVHVVVGDNGPGLSQREQARLFETFFTTQPPATTTAGLGLSMSREILRSHGGELRVESSGGAGTRFTVSLPLAPAHPDPPPPQSG